MERIMERFNGKNRSTTIVTIIAVVMGLVVVLAGYGYLFPQESTDDAFIAGHVIMVSPQVSGHIVKVYVNDNEPVTKGELLVALDDRDYQVSLELEKAETAQAQAELNQA